MSSEKASALFRSTKIGQILAGEYRVVSHLGSGAISIVVLVEKISSGEKFTARLFDAEWIKKSSGGLDAFARDAQRLRQIESSNIMRAVATGITKEGSPYLVFEYLEGVDMRRAVAEKEALWVADAAEFGRQACSALSKAHALGLVHRDLRPNNLFLVQGPNDTLRLKVTGFGIGAVADGPHASGEPSTRSIEYAAPEVLAERPVDARADVWSLGVTLYEWVTGSRPFDAKTLADHVRRKQPLFPPKMTSPLGVPVPAAFESVVRKCLQTDPRSRFRDAGELSIALAPFPTMAVPDSAVATIARRPDHATFVLPPPPESGDARTLIAPASLDEKTLVAGGAPASHDAKTLVSGGAPASHDAKTLIARGAPASHDAKTLIARGAPASHDAKTLIATGIPAIPEPADAKTPILPLDARTLIAPPRLATTAPMMGSRPIRTVFLSREDNAPESVTTIRDLPQLMPIELPPVVVVKMESSRGLRVLAGVVALLVLLTLPILYLRFRARSIPPPPDPDVAQREADAHDNAAPKSHKRAPRPVIGASGSVAN